MSRHRNTRFIVSLHLVLALCSPARADVAVPSAPKKTEITLAGPAAASAVVKEVVAELLARDGVGVTWQSQSQFHTWDVFDARSDLDVAAWIDLSAPSEARLYFRSAATDRFYLRALPLPHGIDEIAKEEIAHIVSNAVLALSQGTSETLTRAEARRALHLPTPSAETIPASPPAVPLRFTASALGGAQLLASELPIAAKANLCLALARARTGRTGGLMGVWLDLGYQPSARYQGPVVGAEVQVFSGRAGASWELERTARLRFALGAGADRYQYHPRGDSAHVELAAADSFYVPVLTGFMAADLPLLEHVALTLRLSADVPLAKIHFDLSDGRRQTTRLLSPYPVIPAASLGLTFAF